MVKRTTRKVFIAMLSVLMFLIINPMQVFAAYSGTEDLVAEADIPLTSEYSIHVYAKTRVSYSYEEGITGWITDFYLYGDSKMESNDVRIDTISLVDVGEFGYGSYYETYYVYCTRFDEDFVCYVSVYGQCDEWGDVSSWIDYELLQN